VFLGHTSVSRAGPKRLGQPQGGRVKRPIRARRRDRDMGNQRIEGRRPLGLVKAGNRRRIGGIGPEPINVSVGNATSPLRAGNGAAAATTASLARKNRRFQAGIHRD